jgi:hypothetical protein
VQGSPGNPATPAYIQILQPPPPPETMTQTILKGVFGVITGVLRILPL